MSWSVRATSVRGSHSEDADNLMKLAVESAKASNSDGEDQAQFSARVVADIITGGYVGNTTRKFTVSISGHANPNHAPKAGMSNDFINIQISQES